VKAAASVPSAGALRRAVAAWRALPARGRRWLVDTLEDDAAFFAQFEASRDRVDATRAILAIAYAVAPVRPSRASGVVAGDGARKRAAGKAAPKSKKRRGD
jgi:hypothetical protein